MTDQSVMSIPTAATLPPPSTVRRRLLAAAEAVCAEVGLYEARVEDITRQATLAKGTFYLHFASKEAIIQAVVEEAFRELAERCDAGVRDARSRPERVRSLVAAHLSFYGERPGRMRLLHQARGALKFSRPEWQPLRASLEKHLALLAGLLKPPGSVGGQVRLDAARLLFGTVSGAASVWSASGSDAAAIPPPVAEHLSQLVLDFLLGRARAPRRSESS